MNKDKQKGFFRGLLAGLILLAAVVGVHICLDYRERVKNAVSDEPDILNVEQTDDNITVYLDGLPLDPVGDVEGTDYQLLWALAETLEQPVEWDADTQSLYIGEKYNIWPPATEGVERIAFIINPIQNDPVTEAAKEVTIKYGEDRVVCVDWLAYYNEQEQIDKIATRLARDKSIKALILEGYPGTCATINKLREMRSDIFIVCVSPQENPADVMEKADLVLAQDEVGMGSAMVEQAQKLGAKVFVHYSFPRHMAQPLLSSRRELIQEKCEDLGIEFVNATAPDPTSDVGVAGTQQFILEDVPKMVAQYGKDTAFFATNCSMQIPLIRAVSDNGAIYPQPCCPSPYHGFAAALDIKTPEEEGIVTADYVIAETTRILKEKGVNGRFSTWPVSVSTLSFYVAGDYAFRWINGEVQKEGLDMQVLQQCLEDYAGVKVYANSLVDDGVTYDNWLLLREDYITY